MGLTPLQRSSRYILQPQLTGQSIFSLKLVLTSIYLKTKRDIEVQCFWWEQKQMANSWFSDKIWHKISNYCIIDGNGTTSLLDVKINSKMRTFFFLIYLLNQTNLFFFFALNWNQMTKKKQFIFNYFFLKKKKKIKRKVM